MLFLERLKNYICASCQGCQTCFCLSRFTPRKLCWGENQVFRPQRCHGRDQTWRPAGRSAQVNTFTSVASLLLSNRRDIRRHLTPCFVARRYSHVSPLELDKFLEDVKWVESLLVGPVRLQSRLQSEFPPVFFPDAETVFTHWWISPPPGRTRSPERCPCLRSRSRQWRRRLLNPRKQSLERSAHQLKFALLAGMFEIVDVVKFNPFFLCFAPFAALAAGYSNAL